MTREEWAEAALYAWGKGGLSAVAVEPIARRLKVTKGSFYWHFKDRNALIQAALDLWKQRSTEDVIGELERLESPHEQLRKLFTRAFLHLAQMRVEAAIGAAALGGNALVLPVYEEVQSLRLAYVERLYRGLGLSKASARRYAITACSVFLGSLQIAALEPNGLQTTTQLRAQVRVFQKLLTPPFSG